MNDDMLEQTKSAKTEMSGITSSPLLPRWATIYEVSQALSISRAAVYDVARRALSGEQPWVRWDTPPYRFTRACILIDTESSGFADAVGQWKARGLNPVFAALLEASAARANQRHLHEMLCGEEQSAAPSNSVTDSPADHPTHDSPQSTTWFGSWLAEQGLHVYKNALATQKRPLWYWQWGVLSAEGGASTLEGAILEALKQRLELVDCWNAGLLTQDDTPRSDTAASDAASVEEEAVTLSPTPTDYQPEMLARPTRRAGSRLVFFCAAACVIVLVVGFLIQRGFS